MSEKGAAHKGRRYTPYTKTESAVNPPFIEYLQFTS